MSYKEKLKNDPEKLAKYKAQKKEQNARYRAAVKADPERLAAQKAKQKENHERYQAALKADPEKMAAHKAKQKECQANYHARVKADPEKNEIRKAKKRDWRKVYYQANKEVYAERALKWRKTRVGLEFPPVEETERKCGTCGVVQPMDQFGINRYRKFGRATRCKSCVKKANASYCLRVKGMAE